MIIQLSKKCDLIRVRNQGNVIESFILSSIETWKLITVTFLVTSKHNTRNALSFI